jgi:hypothetical protein
MALPVKLDFLPDPLVAAHVRPAVAGGPPQAPAALVTPPSHPMTFAAVWIGTVQPTAAALAAARARPTRSITASEERPAPRK